MRTFLIAAVAAGLPLSNAFAQAMAPLPERERAWAVFFFVSAANDRTTRPASLNPACWSDETTGGIGASVEYKLPARIVLATGFHYLGTHQNNERCTPAMELRTGVVLFTVGYAIPLGSRIRLTPRIGFSYMLVDGDFGSLSANDSSVKPTYGISLEGSLTQQWALRGSLDRYTGTTNLFGAGEFKQDFRVASFGGVFRW